MLSDMVWAINQLQETWEKPDSPEAFCASMKYLFTLRDRAAQIKKQRNEQS